MKERDLMDSLGKEEIELQVKQAEIDMEVVEQYQFKEIEQILFCTTITKFTDLIVSHSFVFCYLILELVCKWSMIDANYNQGITPCLSRRKI